MRLRYSNHGRPIDFMLYDRRNTRAAHRFLGKALTTKRHWPPSSITTESDLPPAARRQAVGLYKHRTCKYRNNIIETDQGALKRVIWSTRGFQLMNRASATIKDFEVMRTIRQGHCLMCKPHVKYEVRFTN
jgi:IS6 family transposase